MGNKKKAPTGGKVGRPRKDITNKELGNVITKALDKVVHGPVVSTVDLVQKKVTTGTPAQFSRAILMEEAKQYGILNFRVLNKAELAEVVGIAKSEGMGQNTMKNNDRVKEVVAGAVKRWKSGFGKGHKREG